ncbi:NlpC/P60 family protein [Solobacterium moorei]|uniref:NlpC/P60 family protein n=1 Tax=Solobacterium moorei TaxID=102148 RepID=UPI0028D4B467|nr:NlpC/P60 family protein [Solobacterium moorei]
MSKLKILFFCIGAIFTTTCCFNRVYADESSDNTETTEQLSNTEENALYVDGKLANGWIIQKSTSGVEISYFYKNGFKLTGIGVDENGECLFIEGLLAEGLQEYSGAIRYYKDGRGYTGFADGKYYYQGSAANGWVHHEQPVDGYYYLFYKDGVRLTGMGTDADGEHLFINGVLAQGIQSYNGIDLLYEKGDPVTGYRNGKYYVSGYIANGWMFHQQPIDGKYYLFYKDGVRLTGKGIDAKNEEHYYVNGVLAEGFQNITGVELLYEKGDPVTGYRNGKYYVSGILAEGFQNITGVELLYEKGDPVTGYRNGKYYVSGYIANGWMFHQQPIDGKYYLFYKDGLPLTGKGTDADGEHLFINGSLAQGLNEYEGIYHIYHDGKIVDETQEILEVNGIVANGWFLHDVPINGVYYFFYKDGKKLTGMGTDGNGEHLFINGLLAQGVVKVSGQERLYKDGNLESGLVDGKYYASGYLANGWVHHIIPLNGLYYCFYKLGLPLTGKGTDADGEHLFINGSLAEGLHFYNGEWRNYKGGNAVNNSIYNNAIETALSFVGKVPYVWGGASPSGFDCSGLVMYCYGIKERTTYVQQTLGTHRYDTWNAPAGALYFWGSDSEPYHVAISLGNGNYVHAATPSDGIILSNINYFSPNYYIVIGQ